MNDADEDTEGRLDYLTRFQRDSDPESSGLTAAAEPISTVMRPHISPRISSKSKKNRSSARASFLSGGTSMAEDDDEQSTVFVPKKSKLSRQAIEKSALRKSLAATIPPEQQPVRQTEDRPSYSSDALSELKSSTPSTPKELAGKSDVVPEPEPGRQIDLASKFGSSYAPKLSSAIPTDAEIREKKERRARLAKEENYIDLDDEDEKGSADDSDNSNKERALFPQARSNPSKENDSRLTQDDEDIAEGFDDFVEDGGVAVGRRAQGEQKRKRTEEIRIMIEEAEGGNGSDQVSEDESEAERNAAYEAAQTRAGMDGIQRNDRGAQPRRPRTPPIITPLPNLGEILQELRAKTAKNQNTIAQKRQRMEEVNQELADIEARKIEIQRLVNEAAEKYERLFREAGLSIPGHDERLLTNGSANAIEDVVMAHQLADSDTGSGFHGHGLENLGNT